MSGSQVIKPEFWHARRAKNIGSSEIAALFDCAPPFCLSRFALWHVKAGLVPPPEVANDRVKWGTLLEDVIGAAVAEEKGWTIRPGHFCIDETTPGMSCTLDFVIEHAEGMDGPGVLETKNIDWLAHKRSWTGDEPPPHILLQLQHQMACTGYKWGCIAGLVGGNTLRTYVYEARPKLIADIRRRVTAFWKSIDEGKPPAVDGSDGASHALRHLFPEVQDDAVDFSSSNEWPVAVAEFIAAGERQREAKAEYDAAKNQVALLLGEHKRGYGGGFSVSCSVVDAKPDRPAREGEIIPGRKESRRYTAKEKTE